MKKFLAIVMCLAMALSMMTVVSFAATGIYVGAKAEVTAAPGAVVEIPVYFSAADGSDVTISINEFYAIVPDAISFELVAGKYSLDQVYVDAENAKRISVYDDAGKTFAKDEAAFIIKATLPAEVGQYTIAFEEYCDTCFLMDADFNLIEDVTVEDIVINVEQPAPSYEAGYYNLTTADNKASVTYFGTVGAATLYVATYNKVGAGLELVSVKTADIAAGTVDELTTVTTEAADAGEVVKAFLWDADLNTVAVGTLAE